MARTKPPAEDLVERNDVRIALAITMPCLVVIGFAIYLSTPDRMSEPFAVYFGDRMTYYFIMIIFSHLLLSAWRRVL